MPILMDRDMKDFREMERKELQDLAEWEKNRVIKKCKSCGNPYSYERGDIDPKKCQRCRGDEGDLIY